VVTEVDADAGTVTCDVWLERPDGFRPVEGTATVTPARPTPAFCDSKLSIVDNQESQNAGEEGVRRR
jgi:hypothetical protein